MRRRQASLANGCLVRAAGLKISIELKNLISRKVACFGPLCLSSDSTRCQESESLSDFQIRRAVPPDFQLPFWDPLFPALRGRRAVTAWTCTCTCTCKCACMARVPWEGCRPRRSFPATWLMPNRVGDSSLTPSVLPGTDGHPQHGFHSSTVYHAH